MQRLAQPMECIRLEQQFAESQLADALVIERGAIACREHHARLRANFPQAAGEFDAAGHAQLLRAMVGAFGRPRTSNVGPRLFLKLDSWHARALPLFRQAFPATPWIFVIRDPVEVLVSHLRRPGMQAAGVLPASITGVDWRAGDPPERYAAAALAGMCEAAEHAYAAGGGLVVNYTEAGAADQIRALLEDSVRLQMRSDVPFGAYLSGGVDSSSVVALLAKLGAGEIKTFTLVYDDNFPNKGEDRHFARVVA